jgi:hypothetical protein
MEIEDLEQLANLALRLGVDEVRECSNLLPKFLLALTSKEKAIDMIALDGPFPEQQRVREQILEPIRSRIAAGEVQAVLFASDVLIGRQEAVMVVVDSPIFRRILRQDYSRVGKTISLGEHHTNDDPAICRQMIGDFFPEGDFSGEAKPGSISLVTVRVAEEDHVRQLKIPKDICVAVIFRGSEGHISAKCRNCSVPMVTVEKDPLLWLMCPRCGGKSFAMVPNLRDALAYAERHGGTFEFDLHFLDEESKRLMPPPNFESQPDQKTFFMLACSWRAK